jgi:hypothetical protein
MDENIQTRLNELKGKPQSEWSDEDATFWNNHSGPQDAIRGQGTPADKVAEQTLRVADDATPESTT